jgi:hypothetical protein
MYEIIAVTFCVLQLSAAFSSPTDNVGVGGLGFTDEVKSSSRALPHFSPLTDK